MKRRPIAFLLAMVLVLQFCLVGALAADVTVAIDKSEGTISVAGSGFDASARLAFMAAYKAEPTFANLDYLNQYTAGADGAVAFDYPSNADLVGGTYYYAALGGKLVKVGVPLEGLKAHSSSRLSVRVRAKAPLNVSAEVGAPRESYIVVSSNPAIAAVTEDPETGKFTVQGLRAGTAIITVRANADFGDASHVITVSVS